MKKPKETLDPKPFTPPQQLDLDPEEAREWAMWKGCGNPDDTPGSVGGE
jgi:hypothetical protein